MAVNDQLGIGISIGGSESASNGGSIDLGRHCSVVVMVAIVISWISSSVVEAQSLAAHNGRFLAVTGDPIPGLTAGEVFGPLGTMDSPVIANDGTTLFAAKLLGGSVTGPTNDLGLFYGQSRDDLQMVVRSGEPEPSGTMPGVVIGDPQNVPPFNSPPIMRGYRISGDGKILVGLHLSGPGITFADDDAAYIGYPGALQVAVRRGDAAPGTAGAVMSSFLGNFNRGRMGLNDAGRICFVTDLSGGDVNGTANDAAIYAGLPGSLSLVVRKGDTGPSGAVVSELAVNSESTFPLQMNDSGQVLFQIRYQIGTGAPAVTAADDHAVWRYTPGGGAIEVVREGDPSPFSGVTFGRPSGTTPFTAGNSSFNGAGSGLVRVGLTGAVTPFVDDSALVAFTPGTGTVVVRLGDAVPGIPGAVITALDDGSMNDGFDVVGRLGIGGAGVTNLNDTLLAVGRPGALQVVAREGNVVPAIAPAVFSHFPENTYDLNGAGQVVFVHPNLGGQVTSVWDPVAGLRLLSITFTVLEVAPGVTKSFNSLPQISFHSHGNGNGRPLTLNDDGEFTGLAVFIDYSVGILKTRTGSLTSFPSTISASAGGRLNLRLDAGAALAGSTYVVVGSLSGTFPGTFAAPLLFPINVDFYTNYMLANLNVAPFNATLGAVNVNGFASASIDYPSGLPFLAGFVVNHCFGVLDPFGVPIFASEDCEFRFTP